MEYWKILFMWISLTIATVKHQTVIDPCPGYAPRTSIVNMCRSGLGIEEFAIGGLELDSVALRITTRQDNCACQIYLQNQTDTYTVYMQKYNKLTAAAPNHSDCGLVINISVTDAIGKDKVLERVECNNGTSFRPITLKNNEKLNFKSTIIEGNFTKGYCLQIFRNDLNTSHPSLQIACTQETANKTKYTPLRKEDTSSTQYVVIGACAGGFVFLISIVVVIVSCFRKNRNNDPVIESNNKEITQIKSDNILYQTSDQCDTTDGNYHTVELEERQMVNNTQNIDGDYISIDVNLSSNSKYKSKPGTQSKCNTQITKEKVGYKVEHVTPGTGNTVEYAVVNKRDRLGENTEPAISLNNEYAAVDKSGRLDKNIKHVTPKPEAL